MFPGTVSVDHSIAVDCSRAVVGWVLRPMADCEPILKKKKTRCNGYGVWVTSTKHQRMMIVHQDLVVLHFVLVQFHVLCFFGECNIRLDCLRQISCKIIYHWVLDAETNSIYNSKESWN